MDLVGFSPWLIYNNATSGTDVISNDLFAVLLTSAHVGSAAKASVPFSLSTQLHSYDNLADTETSLVAKLQKKTADLFEIQLHTLLWNIHRPLE